MKRTLLLVTALALAAAGAHAGTLAVTLTLTQPWVSANPGDQVDFDATVSAPWINTDPVYLNGDNLNSDSPLSLDDSPFFANFPLFLNPGDSFEGTLFTVTVPVETTSGSYAGYFEIDGGADGDASQSQNQSYLGSAIFNVEVGQPTGIPEPSTLGLLAVGSGLLLFGRLRKPERK